jgi:pimeloyl-ACP methyl ester carboxylesterase
LLAAVVAALPLVLALYDRTAPQPVDWLAASGLDARFTSVAGHQLRYVRAGRGPAVMLVHGFGSSLYTWKDVVPRLASDHEVVALDLPGFGLSDQPPDLTADALPESVVGLMEVLGLQRAALVGNSLGGATVALVAASHPDRTRALVLVDAAGFNMSPDRQPAFVRYTLSPAGRLLGVLPGRRLLVELALRDVFHDERLLTEERVAEYVRAARRPGSAASIQSLATSMRGRYGLVQEALARVEAPTLVVWGREDRWIPISDSERFAAAIAAARTRVIENCGHMPQEERPAELAAAVRSFLEDVERGAEASLSRRAKRSERRPGE